MLYLLIALTMTSGTFALDLTRFLWIGQTSTEDQANPEIVEIVRWRQPVCVTPGKNVPPCLLGLRKFQNEYERLSSGESEATKNSRETNDSPCKSVLSPKVVTNIGLRELETSELEIIPRDGISAKTETETTSLDDWTKTRPRRARQMIVPTFGGSSGMKPPAIYITKVLNSPVTATLVAQNCFPDIGIPLCEGHQADLKIESIERNTGTDNAMRIQIQPTKTAEIKLGTMSREPETFLNVSNGTIEKTTELLKAGETDEQREDSNDFNESSEESDGTNGKGEPTTTTNFDDTVNEESSGFTNVNILETSTNPTPEVIEPAGQFADKFENVLANPVPLFNAARAKDLLNKFPYDRFNKIISTTKGIEEAENTTPNVNIDGEYEMTTEPPEAATNISVDPNNPRIDEANGNEELSIVDDVEDIVDASRESEIFNNPIDEPTEAIIDRVEPKVQRILAVEPTEKPNIFRQLWQIGEPLASAIPNLLAKEAENLRRYSDKMLNGISIRDLQDFYSEPSSPRVKKNNEQREKIVLNASVGKKRDVRSAMFEAIGKLFAKSSERPLLVQRWNDRPLLVEKPIFVSEKPSFPDWLDAFPTNDEEKFANVDCELMEDPVYIVSKPSQELQESLLDVIFHD